MKERILRILKVVLAVSVTALAVLLVFGFALLMHWPLWVGLFLVLLLAGLAIGGVALWKLWKRRREQRFVQEVLDQDESRIKAMSASERDDQRELQERWKEAVATLRKSHLKKQGNPLYVLPWYLVAGESGSGKTTSLSSARLASPFAEAGRSAGVSGTRNCDWWFLENAIVVDTAGRYTIPVNGEPDREEWQKFLSLLVKYRRREPLNGLIVTVAADKLVGAGRDAIEEEARTIHRRIDEMMRVLGVKFPVYVLVTKCDLIQGMNSFCGQLPEGSLRQPMGMVNQALSTDIAAFTDSAMKTVSKRLRNMRLLLLYQLESKQADPALLLYPEEFEGMKPGLEGFMKTLFSHNPYQETPILRGLFFSSGRQEGSPFSTFTRKLGVADDREVLPGTARGLFLHDFFAKILPRDRNLLTPTRRALEWSALTGNLGLTAWIVLCVALCGLLSFSFVKNLRTIGEIAAETPKMPVLRGEITADTLAEDQFRKAIVRVEEQNRNWWIPRFGLRESLHVEKGLKERYGRQFREGFVQPFDRRLMDALRTMPPTVPDEQYAPYLIHLTRRINVLRASLERDGLEAMRKKPRPSWLFMGRDRQTAAPETDAALGELYLHYLAWRSDPDETRREIAALQASLGQLYAVRGSDWQWLLSLTDRDAAVAAVTLDEFWGPGQAIAGERQVPGRFTSKGRQAIDDFLKEMEEAWPEAPLLAKNKAEFDAKYRALAFEAWKSFADGFAGGAARLKNPRDVQQAAAKMAQDGGPWFALLNRITLELEPVAAGGSLPPWLAQVLQFQLVRAQGLVQESSGALGKAAESGKQLLATVEQKLGRDVGAKKLEQQMVAAQAFGAYKTSLAAIAPAAASRAQAYQLTAQVFGEDPVTSKSPFYAGYGALEKLKTALGDGKAPDETVGRLIAGPMDFLWAFACRETAAHLEGQWNEQVLAPVAGMSAREASTLLVGTDGLVWKFVKGPAAPFLSRTSRSGYYAKEALGSTIPLDKSLFAYLNKGAQVQARAQAAPKQSNYTVGIRGLPTEANRDASIQPHGTKLELYCGASLQSIANYNYPVHKTFSWSPDSCSDVILQIEVADFVLTRRFMGPQAFPEFLKSFAGGQRTLSPGEFPGEKAALARLGIKWIKVHYQFFGSGPVIQTITTPAGQAPGSIGKR